MRQRRDRRQRWALLPALTELPALSELTAVAAWRSPDRCHACVFPMFSSEVNTASPCACERDVHAVERIAMDGGRAAAEHATGGSRGTSRRVVPLDHRDDPAGAGRRNGPSMTARSSGSSCTALQARGLAFLRDSRARLSPGPFERFALGFARRRWLRMAATSSGEASPARACQRIRRAEGGEVGSCRPSTP